MGDGSEDGGEGGGVREVGWEWQGFSRTRRGGEGVEVGWRAQLEIESHWSTSTIF